MVRYHHAESITIPDIHFQNYNWKLWFISPSNETQTQPVYEYQKCDQNLISSKGDEVHFDTKLLHGLQYNGQKIKTALLYKTIIFRISLDGA